MHGIQRNKKTQTMLLVKDCRLSELGMCKKRFRQKSYQQEFCKPKHQQLYHRIIKKEKRLVVRLLGEHDKRIKELERKVKKSEEENHGRK